MPERTVPFASYVLNHCGPSFAYLAR